MKKFAGALALLTLLIGCSPGYASELLTRPAKARLTDHQRVMILQRQLKALARQVKAPPSAGLKHAWPALTDAEKVALGDVLKGLPKGVKVEILCNDGACTDLAQDIDDACEAAGIDSSLDRSFGPLPYGVYIQVSEFDRAMAQQAIEALKKATDGRLAPELKIAPANAAAPAHVTVIIGKYRAPK